MGTSTEAETLTVSGALFSRPSLTISCATYNPSRSATNVGVTEAGSLKDAVLESGVDKSAQLKVSGSPSMSVDPVPSSVTVSPRPIL